MNIYKLSEMSADRFEMMKHRSSKDILKDEVFNTVKIIIDQVKLKGDEAVAELTLKYDNVNLDIKNLRVQKKEIDKAWDNLDKRVIKAIEDAILHQRKYNEHILPSKLDLFEISQGILVGRKSSPLNRVALYVPCGKGSYPSSFITIAVPAVVAGVKEIELILPPKSDGSIDSAVLATAKMLGIENIYRANGIAGIGAAAFGTKLLPKVDKIVGPGGEYIMAAQMYVQMFGTSVALFFGPSECMIIADKTAEADLVAADLINEAEHGMQSSAILITNDSKLASDVKKNVEEQLKLIPEWRRKFAESALSLYGGIVLVENLEQAVELANDWGNEHIQIVTGNPWEIANQLNSASEILVGQWTTFSAISYAIGVPACLPTGQFAKIYQGVTVDTYLKYSAITELKQNGLQQISGTITTLSEYEGFPAHTRSISIRQEKGLLK